MLENKQINLSIIDEENQNLTPSQKLLLMWHERFGHKNIPFVQRLFRHLPKIFSGETFTSASKCEVPMCAMCQYAKAHRKKLRGKTSKIDPTSEGALKRSYMRAGDAVSVDHFESRLHGRTYRSFGRAISDKYVGGCIFVDQMSGRIKVEHQLGFSSSETIRAKKNFERDALDHGVIVKDYMGDNGILRQMPS